RSQQLDWLRKRLQHPGRRLQEQGQVLTQLDSRLQRAMLRFLEQRRGNLQMLARNLENISPLQTLQRGYSITRTPEGKLISTSSQVKAGDDIISTLANGQIVSTVKEIKA
ncbi:MAG: exodeoxyribonuclease VII large subunit, partial [Pseudohongiella sp.]